MSSSHPPMSTLQDGSPQRRLRIALYSHDTQGLGHIRRNLAIAAALATGEAPPAILLISGTQAANALTMPAGADCITLPAIGKDARGVYDARRLFVGLDELVRMRGQVIERSLAAFAPDVFIVDKTPGGLLGELRPALRMLRRRGNTRCVLGLRDVLDDPVTAAREWHATRSSAVVQAYYHTVWIYGDPSVYDAVAEYPFLRSMMAKVRFTGYLNRCQFDAQAPVSAVDAVAALGLDSRRMALCMVGGGQDGFGLATAFLQAELPADTGAVLLTGPFMDEADRRHLQQLADQQPHARIVDFTAHPESLMKRADWVVSMGGYNTTCEVLSAHKPALIVPRVRPRLEQYIRAARLEQLGLIDMVHPDQLTPAHIGFWLAHRHSQPARARTDVDLRGLWRLPSLLRDLLGGPASALMHGVQPDDFHVRATKEKNHDRTASHARWLHSQNVSALL